MFVVELSDGASPLHRPRQRGAPGSQLGEIILRSAGYAVEAARTWFDVLARVVVSPPDALLVDLAQLDGRGVELCGEARRLSGVRILVLLAVGDERQRVRALEAGAGDFVLRPFGVDELLARLRDVLRQPEALEASTRLTVHETGELRVLVAGIRAKLERDRARPEYLINEPGVGYRLTRRS